MASPSNAKALQQSTDPPPPYVEYFRPQTPTSGSVAVEPHAKDTGSRHPIIAAAVHNGTRSPLCRLPDKLLVQIMKELDAVALECLRRTSRSFLRLFNAACNSSNDFEQDAYHPWPTSWLALSDDQHHQLLALLRRDLYCHGCRTARETPDWNKRVRLATKVYLHCSGCKVDHPACLFSLKERHSPLSTRLCIGHEGYVRLCEHTVVSWPQIVSSARANLGRGGKFFAVAQCKDRGHDAVCCFRDIFSRSSPNLRPATTPRYPTLANYYDLSENILAIRLAWTAHMPLMTTGNQALMPQQFRSRLVALRDQGARFICTEAEPGQIIGSRLFDPNSCDCLPYEGMEMTTWDRPVPNTRDAATCRVDQTRRLDPLIQARHGVQVKIHAYERLSRAEAQEHTDMIVCSSAQGDVPQVLTVTASPCLSGKQCIQVNHMHWIQIGLGDDGALRLMNSAWYQALDPESYSLTDDEDGFGVYWCKEKGCRNYYQHGRSRLRPLLVASDYNRTCPTEAMNAEFRY